MRGSDNGHEYLVIHTQYRVFLVSFVLILKKVSWSRRQLHRPQGVKYIEIENSLIL